MTKLGELVLEVGLEAARKKAQHLECFLEIRVTDKEDRRHTEIELVRLTGLRGGHLAKTVIARGRQELARQVGMASQNGTTVSHPRVVIPL